MHIACFIVRSVTVVGDRLVTVNESRNIEVRLVHTPGHVMFTISANANAAILCMSSVAEHSELIITGGDDGAVHLWNINKGVHVRKIVQLESAVTQIVASSSRLMCAYGDYDMKLAMVLYDVAK